MTLPSFTPLVLLLLALAIYSVAMGVDLAA
jgi:hypothetical protein